MWPLQRMVSNSLRSGYRPEKKPPTAAKKDAAQGQEGEVAAVAAQETKKSNNVQRKLEKRQEGRKLDSHIEEQFSSGRLYACISSRPGQCGRADG